VLPRFKDKPERLVEPNPVVAGPAIEALRYAASEPALRDMYMNLLAASMDSETAHKAHPAFVETIKQLTPDEARIVRLMSISRSTICFDLPMSEVEHQPPCPLVDPAGCDHPELILNYLDNIERLGLANSDRAPILQSVLVGEPPMPFVGTTGVRATIRPMTHYGRQFCDACITED
jgi:hypothetical protein